MKVDPLSPLARTSSVRKARTVRRSRFLPKEGASLSDIAPSSESLLSLQMVEEAFPALTALEQGERTLDLLQEIQLALLEGKLAHQHLQRLLELTRQPGEKAQDPVLQEALEEIALRAQVELAKYDKKNKKF
ncbi:MAG: flagellar assembly protein FliX [Holosporales bacterium]|nr:flagellar assembly protein FliX [Holosporales bacterium]